MEKTNKSETVDPRDAALYAITGLIFRTSERVLDMHEAGERARKFLDQFPMEMVKVQK